MKTINDFIIIDEVAVLKDVSYAEEAKIVDEYLKLNKHIKYASVITKDSRYFELKNEKLINSKEDKFINPYFEKVDRKAIENKGIVNIENIDGKYLDIINALDKRISALELDKKMVIDCIAQLLAKLK